MVEDDEATSAFICEALADVGYQVVNASNGSHALARLDVDTPDLVLLDLHMPVLDGWGFMAALAEQPVRPPVVVMSAGGGIAARTAGELGAAGHIEKPFAISALIAVVDHCALPSMG